MGLGPGDGKRVMGENTGFGRFRPYFLIAGYGRKRSLWSISPIIGIGSPSPRRIYKSTRKFKRQVRNLPNCVELLCVNNYYIRSSFSDAEQGHWRRFLLSKHMKRSCFTSYYSITFATAPFSPICHPEFLSLRIATGLLYPLASYQLNNHQNKNNDDENVNQTSECG